MSYTVTEESNGIVVKFDHDFSDAMLAADKECLAHPRFEEFTFQMIDLETVDAFTISHDVIRRIADLDAKNYDRNPNLLVILVSSNLLVKGLNRIYEGQVKELGASDKLWRVELFPTVKEAREWMSANL